MITASIIIGIIATVAGFAVQAGQAGATTAATKRYNEIASKLRVIAQNVANRINANVSLRSKLLDAYNSRNVKLQADLLREGAGTMYRQILAEAQRLEKEFKEHDEELRSKIDSDTQMQTKIAKAQEDEATTAQLINGSITGGISYKQNAGNYSDLESMNNAEEQSQNNNNGGNKYESWIQRQEA